ncbi:MAG: hypothetical protein HYW77_03470 [Parcubacteria group bacterium]|nr:hypothetical protein [Parcubacteria group bacterium]
MVQPGEEPPKNLTEKKPVVEIKPGEAEDFLASLESEALGVQPSQEEVSFSAPKPGVSIEIPSEEPTQPSQGVVGEKTETGLPVSDTKEPKSVEELPDIKLEQIGPRKLIRITDTEESQVNLNMEEIKRKAQEELAKNSIEPKVLEEVKEAKGSELEKEVKPLTDEVSGIDQQLEKLDQEEYERKKNAGIIERSAIEKEYKEKRVLLKKEFKKNTKTFEKEEKPQDKPVEGIQSLWSKFKKKFESKKNIKEGQELVKKELPQWTKEELAKAGLTEEEQRIYGELASQIVNNKNIWEQFSAKLSERKVFGIGAEAMVGFAGGMLGRSAVRSFVKYSIGWIAGAGTGALAGAGVGGAFGYLHSRSAAQKIEYDAKNWGDVISQNKDSLPTVIEAVKQAIKQNKVKGDREGATRLVLQLRQLETQSNIDGKSPVEVLKAKDESEERNEVLDQRKQALLNRILEEKRTNIRKAALRGALRGAVVGAIGGTLASLASEAFASHEGVIGQVGEKLRSAWDSVRDHMPSFGGGHETIASMPAHQGVPEELDKFISRDSAGKIIEHAAETKEAVKATMKEAMKQTLENHKPLADHIIVEKGDNIWNLSRDYIRSLYYSNGIQYEPSDAQILEASKIIASDPDNSIAVGAWGIDGKTPDIRIPVGKDLDFSGLRAHLVEKWGLQAVGGGETSGASQFLDKAIDSVKGARKLPWILGAAGVFALGGGLMMAFGKGKRPETRTTPRQPNSSETETRIRENESVPRTEKRTRTTSDERLRGRERSIGDGEPEGSGEPVLVGEFRKIERIFKKQNYSQTEINTLRNKVSAKSEQDVKDLFNALVKVYQKENSTLSKRVLVNYIADLVKAYRLNSTIKLDQKYYDDILVKLGRRGG